MSLEYCDLRLPAVSVLMSALVTAAMKLFRNHVGDTENG